MSDYDKSFIGEEDGVSDQLFEQFGDIVLINICWMKI